MKQVGGLSDVGRRRTLNEDAFLIDDELGLYIVADGMGGHAAGEVASREAVDIVRETVSRERATLEGLEGSSEQVAEALPKALRVLESAVQAATYLVFAMGEHDPTHYGMGTTLSALALRGHVGLIAQVGDSRVYLVRDGEAKQLTEDHTLVAWQIREGLLSPEEAMYSPHKNVITRAIGSQDYVQVDTHVVSLQSGDSLLLCSDGLHGYLHSAEIAPIVDLGPTLASRRFIDLANQRGGRDNITAIVLRLI